MTTTFSTEVDFAGLAEDFLRLTEKIGWCSVATVDEAGRPRNRILHVLWEIEKGVPVGYVSTNRSPVKTAHLAQNPYVSCSYWTAEHSAVFADCRAAWLDDESKKRHVWELVAKEAAARGFDPYDVWAGGVTDPGFQVLHLRPWRVQVTLPDLPNGQTIKTSHVWHAS